MWKEVTKIMAARHQEGCQRAAQRVERPRQVDQRPGPGRHELRKNFPEKWKSPIANVEACCSKTQESNIPKEVSDEEDMPDVLETPHETRERIQRRLERRV